MLKGIAYKTHTVPAPINRVQQPKWAYPTLHCINFLVEESTHTYTILIPLSRALNQSIALSVRLSVSFDGFVLFFFFVNEMETRFTHPMRRLQLTRRPINRAAQS